MVGSGSSLAGEWHDGAGVRERAEDLRLVTSMVGGAAREAHGGRRARSSARVLTIVVAVAGVHRDRVRLFSGGRNGKEIDHLTLRSRGLDVGSGSGIFACS
jgi:hypothetical protein